MKKKFFLMIGIILSVIIIANATPLHKSYSTSEDIFVGFIGDTYYDDDGLHYKMNSNGYLEIYENDDLLRKFGFALKSEEITISTSDLSWNSTFNGSSNIWNAHHSNAGGDWDIDFDFSSDSLKVTHRIENNWKNLTNVSLFYIFTLNDNETIEFNNTQYPLNNDRHITGELDNILPLIQFPKTTFSYQDVIDDGFNITDVYVGNASIIGNPNIRVLGVGVTKGDRVFQLGKSIIIDPEINKVYDDSSNLFLANLTEGSIHGARALSSQFFMNFNGAFEGTYIKEGSINNNPGTTVNSPLRNITCDSPAGGGCVQFDGVDQYLTADYLDPDIFSISFWFKPTGAQSGRGIVNIGDQLNDANPRILFQRASSSTISLYFNGGFRLTHTGVSDDVWHHIVLVFDGTKWTSYMDVDDVLTSVQAKGTFNADSIFMGNGFNGYYDGQIDQFQVFERALTSYEVQQLNNGTINNSEYIGKYARQGTFNSLVFFNETKTWWNVTFDMADTFSNKSGVVDNLGINLSYPSLVSYWALDGKSGADEKGNNNASVVDAAVRNATGLSSDAVLLTSNQYITFADSASFDTMLNGTIAMWVYTDSVASSDLYIGKACGGAGTPATQAFSIGDSATTGTFQSFISGQTYNWNSGALVDEWFHIALTYNNTQITTYVNGEFDSTGAKTSVSAPNSAVVTLGEWCGFNSFDFNGKEDEVLLYNDSLGAEDIKALYKAGLSQHATTNITLQTRVADNYNLSDSNLSGFWSLNAGVEGSCNEVGWPSSSPNPILCAERDLSPLSCVDTVNFSVASSTCTDVGLRLCTDEEAAQGVHSGTGCGFDATQVWSSDVCGVDNRTTRLGDGSGSASCVAQSSTADVACCGDMGTTNDELGINNGSVIGAVLNESSGVVGKGYIFDGTDDWIRYNVSGFGGSFPLTRSVSVWAKTDDITTNSQSMHDWEFDEAAHDSWDILLETTNLALRTGGSNYIATLASADNNWHHYVVTSVDTDADNILMYQDGKLLAKVSSVNSIPITTNVNVMSSGVLIDGGLSSFFDGSIDETRVYNRTLNLSDIQNLYELGSYHIEWNDTIDAGLMRDGIPNNNSEKGKFYQFIPLFSTNNTDVSAYLINHSVQGTNNSELIIPPLVNIIHPENLSILNGTTFGLNFSIEWNGGVGTCEYNINAQPVNTTGFDCSINTTALGSSGNNQLIFYAINTEGGLGFDVVNFTLVEVADRHPNITNFTWENATGIINGTVIEGDVVTINATVTDDNGLSNVWVIIWDGAVGISDIIFQEFMNLITGDLWSADIQTNDSFNIGENNFTIYANDTINNITQVNGTFIMNETIFRFGKKLQIWRNASSDTDVSFVDTNGNWFMSGRVGIGTSIPTEKLEVDGNINVSGNIEVSGGMNITENVIIKDRLFVGTSPEETSAIVNPGDAGFQGNVISEGLFAFPQNSSSAMIIFNAGDDLPGKTRFFINFAGELNTTTRLFCDSTSTPFLPNDNENLLTILFSAEFGTQQFSLPIEIFHNSTCATLNLAAFGLRTIPDLTSVSYVIGPEGILRVVDGGLISMQIGAHPDAQFVMNAFNGSGEHSVFVNDVAGADGHEAFTIHQDIKDFTGTFPFQMLLFSSTGADSITSSMIELAMDVTGINNSFVTMIDANLVGDPGNNSFFDLIRADAGIRNIIGVGSADALSAVFSNGVNITDNVTNGGVAEVFALDNDIVYVGNTENFTSISFALDTISSQNQLLNFSYCNNSGSYESLGAVSDTTDGFQESGTVSFIDPSNRGTCNQQMNGTAFPDTNQYTYIALQRTRNNIVTNPVIDRIGISGSTQSFLLRKDLIKLQPVSTPPIICEANTQGGTYYDSDLAIECSCNGVNWVQKDDWTTICA